ncbi:MAG: enoyl-CoA hydratase/isomerase family protein [Renibacterium sp.]|nr:enoyl-CoA hydratase/isomerase family protein [Renibacterium sp.]
MDYEHLLLEQDGAVLTVTVNRPGAMNALSQELVEELWRLSGELLSLGTDGVWPVRGVILTGAGEKAFVAGADIAEMAEMSPAEGEAYGRRMQEVTLRLEGVPVPVIAAVNGYALGGGCELAMACDLIYASAKAQFGQPEVSLGLVPGFGGSVRLQQRIGIGMARELIYTGRRIGATESHRIGLANAVFDDRPALLAGARATLDEITGRSAPAVANCKATINAAAGLPVPDGLDVEAHSFNLAFRTADMREGTRAFLQKRPPVFPGH